MEKAIGSDGGQEHPMSCGAACVRQLLLDTGIHVEEHEIRVESGFEPELGIYYPGLKMAINKYHREKFEAGSADPEQLPLLIRRAPLIVMLDHHWVIVDGMNSDGLAIRDPGSILKDGRGFEGIMDRNIFDEKWQLGIHQVVFRIT